MKSGRQVYFSKILKVSSTDLEQVVEIHAGERQWSAYHAMSVDDWWILLYFPEAKSFLWQKFHVFSLTYSIPLSLILI